RRAGDEGQACAGRLPPRRGADGLPGGAVPRRRGQPGRARRRGRRWHARHRLQQRHDPHRLARRGECGHRRHGRPALRHLSPDQDLTGARTGSGPAIVEVMKRIGLLGGMSWESTVEYYRLINEAVASRLGGLHSARLLLSSLDFAEIEEMQVAGDWAAAARLLTSEARALEGAGAELIVLCTNTMHRVAEDIERGTGVPFVHLAD